MVAAIIAAAVSISVFAASYVTEGRRARRRRLDEEAVSAAIAFVAAASKRRRQLGVLNSMSRRPSLAGKNMFQLDPPPEDVGNAPKRYALILDDYGEAEVRVRFFCRPRCMAIFTPLTRCIPTLGRRSELRASTSILPRWIVK